MVTWGEVKDMGCGIRSGAMTGRMILRLLLWWGKSVRWPSGGGEMVWSVLVVAKLINLK